MGFENGPYLLNHIAGIACVLQIEIGQHASLGLVRSLEFGFNVPWSYRRIRLVDAGNGERLSFRRVDTVPHALEKQAVMREHDDLCGHVARPFDSCNRAFAPEAVLAVKWI